MEGIQITFKPHELIMVIGLIEDCKMKGGIFNDSIEDAHGKMAEALIKHYEAL